MGYDNIRMVLEVNGEIITERMVRKYFSNVEEMKKKWHSMYALNKMNKPFNIYIDIPSQMESKKRFKKDKIYIKHYESEK